MRKAFQSVFKFLYDEKLWWEDPTEHIRKSMYPTEYFSPYEPPVR
jgi:hypothetical protein